MIISLGMTHADGLRLCSQVRSLDRTRHLPLIILVEPGDDARLLRGLDMGVNDYLIVRPIDANEMLAPACARRSSASVTPIFCAAASSRASRWRSPMRSPGCTTAATWKRT